MFTIGTMLIIGAGAMLKYMNYDNTQEPTTDTELGQATYEYFYNLTPVEREEYFNTNEYLKQYGDKYFYHDRELMAKSMAEIARRERREFTNRYNRF